MLALKSGGEEDPELARSRAIRACMPVRGFSAEPAPPRPPPPPPSLDAVDAAAVSALGEAPGVDAEASSPPHSMPPSSSSSLLLSCRRKDAGRDMLRALSLEDFAERKLASLLALALVPLALTAGALAGALAGACSNPLDVIKTRLQTQVLLPFVYLKMFRLKHTITRLKCLKNEFGMFRVHVLTKMHFYELSN